LLEDFLIPFEQFPTQRTSFYGTFFPCQIARDEPWEVAKRKGQWNKKLLLASIDWLIDFIAYYD